MTLFEECKKALSADFSMVEGESEKAALSILNSYPLRVVLLDILMLRGIIYLRVTTGWWPLKEYTKKLGMRQI